MKIEQLRQLIEIVHEGSMNRAAINLYMARSSLSTSMKNLEESFGEVIFERSHKGVSLTDFGQAVYRQAKDIVERIDFLADINKNYQQPKLSIVTLYSTLANHAMLKLVEEHPGMELSGNIEETHMEGVISKVRSGLAELGIATLFSNTENLTKQKFRANELEFHKLAQRRLYLIVGPKNPLYHKEEDRVSVEDFKGFTYIANYHSPADISFYDSISQEGHRDHTEFGVSDLGLALKLVEYSESVLIDTYEAQAFNIFYSSNQLRFLPIIDMPIDCQFGYLKLKGTKLSSLAEEYLYQLKSLLKEI